MKHYENDKINEVYETREMLGSRLKTKGRATRGFFLGWKKDLFSEYLLVFENEHLVRLELKLGTQKFTFFFLYFPPYKSIDKDCVEFFNRLDPIVAHEDIVVLGDMNARLGNENTDVDSRNSKDLKKTHVDN